MAGLGMPLSRLLVGTLHKFSEWINEFHVSYDLLPLV